MQFLLFNKNEQAIVIGNKEDFVIVLFHWFAYAALLFIISNDKTNAIGFCVYSLRKGGKRRPNKASLFLSQMCVYVVNALTHKRKRGYQHNYSYYYYYASSPRCAFLIVHNDCMFVQHTMCALNYDTIFHPINRKLFFSSDKFSF